MLLTTPLIREFKRKYPSNPIDVVAQPLLAQVLVNSPHVRRVFTHPTGSELRKQNYALSVDFLSTPGSALLSWKSGARQRVGYRLRYRTMWYTHPVERRVEPLYNPLTKFDLVKGIGVVPGDNILPELFIGSEDEAWAERKWVDEGLDTADSVIALAPWSKREWRRWSFESWIAVLERIAEQHDVRFVLFASEGERAELKPWMDGFGCQVRRPDSGEVDSRLRGNDEGVVGSDDNIVWAGADHILKVAALMKRCRMLICADNGLKHIAVASGVPTLTVFTGSEPEVWNPPDDARHRAVDMRKEGAGIGELLTVYGEMTP